LMDMMMPEMDGYESISKINFWVEESVAYSGFVQEKEATTLLESDGPGFISVEELVKTGALPLE